MPEEILNPNAISVADVARNEAKKKKTPYMIDPDMVQGLINDNATPDYYDTLNGEVSPKIGYEVNNSIQSMFDKRKAAMQQRRASQTNISKYTALGNVLRSLVQPLGWAVGGSVAPVQPYDNRQYIDAYNRALQYDNNVVNAGLQEEEYQLRSDEYERKRNEAREDFLAKMDAQKEVAQIQADARIGVAQIQADARKAVAEINGKYKVSKNGRKVGDSVQEALLKRAGAAYPQYRAREEAAGRTPKPIKEYLKDYVVEEGYDMSPNGDGSGGRKGGFEIATKPKVGGFE